MIDRGAGLVPGEFFFIGRGDLRCFEVEVMQCGRALQLGGLAQSTAWQFDVRMNRLQHRIKRFAAHRAIKQRRVEEVRQTTATV